MQLSTLDDGQNIFQSVPEKTLKGSREQYPTAASTIGGHRPGV